MLKKILSWFLIGSGGFMLIGFLASNKEGSMLLDLVMLALLVVLPIAGGITLLRSDGKAKKKAEEEARKHQLAAHEKEILRLAAEKQGVLTVSQIVMETSITTEEVESILLELIVKRIADVHTTPEGHAVYEFPEYAPVQDFQRKRIQADLLKE